MFFLFVVDDDDDDDDDLLCECMCADDECVSEGMNGHEDEDYDDYDERVSV